MGEGPSHGGLSPQSASEPSVGFAARPWLPPCPPGHGSLSQLPRSPHRAQQQDPQLQGSRWQGGFNPEPHMLLQSMGHLNFNCIYGYSWGREQGAFLLRAASASWLPASPCPALVAGREDFRAAEVPQLLSHHPHVAVHKHVREQPRFGEGHPLQPSRCGVRMSCWSQKLLPTLMWQPVHSGQDLAMSWPWETPHARSRRQRPGHYAGCLQG